MDWYKNKYVFFNFIKLVKDREIAFLSKAKGENKSYPVRNIFANYSDLMKMYLGVSEEGKDNPDPFKFSERDYNVYYSLARFKLPSKPFSYNPKIRKQESIEWNKKAITNLYSIDLGLDFDAPSKDDWIMAWEEVKLLKEDFDKYKIPYSLKWSGSKGFHIKIPFRCLPKQYLLIDDVDSDDSLFNFNKAFAELLSVYYGQKLGFVKPDGDYGLKTIDLGVFDYRRVWKMDYSFVCETGLISYPLSDQQFEKFDLSMVTPESVLKAGIFNRGDLERTGDVTGFVKYCNEVLGFRI